MRPDYRLRTPKTVTVICRAWIVLAALLVVVGCATRRTVVVRAVPQKIVVAAARPTKVVETRYEVQGYRDAISPTIRHEAHTVYRVTRVPVTANNELTTVPRNGYPTASYTPLPPSAELAAELATQKSITADMRTIQNSMVETERKVQSQYATLLRESAEASKVRQQLESERARIRAGVTAGTSNAPVAAPAGAPGEVKW